jgi:hypothetical protein
MSLPAALIASTHNKALEDTLRARLGFAFCGAQACTIVA